MNSIADKHNRSASPYKGEAIPSDLTKSSEPKNIFKRKIKRAFTHVDRDRSNYIDLEELRKMMLLVKVHLNDSDLINIFNFVDVDNSGTIELPELVNFLEFRFKPPVVIRCTMSNHLLNPYHFLAYHTLNVTDRSLSLKLVPGPDGLAAYFKGSLDPEVNKIIRHGFRLAFINRTRVDSKTFVDIQRRLEIVPLPYVLIFQHEDAIRQVKIQDSSGKFHNLNYAPKKGGLTQKQKEMFSGPSMEMVNPGKALEESKKEIYEYHGHCKHCPRESVWYLNVHLFMEDENFSPAAGFLAYFIMFLIALSTFTYIFQTLPNWEHWSVWQVMEGVVSILFSFEFLIRIASSRSISRYMDDTMNIIDFCAVIPYWIEVVTDGQLDPELLRVIRVIRLLRLVRLATTENMQDILTIYSLTAGAAFHWLLIFIMLGGVVLICIASFEFTFESGVLKNFGVCEMSSGTACENITDNIFYYSFTNVTSASSCESECENVLQQGCCEFDQVIGECQFSNSTGVVNLLNTSSRYAGLCRVIARNVRSDGDDTPYYAVTNSFWWACVTMMMVGYGEMYPITEQGRLVSSIAAALGLMFLAVPVIIVGIHFLLALVTVRYTKLPASVNADLEVANRGSVMQLLEQVNTEVGMRLFKEDDFVVFLLHNVRLDSKYKLEQILGYSNGWSYLPFAYDWTPGLPRITQFKLFVLFALYGRRFQKKRAAQKREEREFFKTLGKLEKQIELPPAKAGQSFPRELKIRRMSSGIEQSRNFGASVSPNHSSPSAKVGQVPNIPISTTYFETPLMKDYSNPLKLGDFCDPQNKQNSLPYVVHETQNVSKRKKNSDSNSMPPNTDNITSTPVFRVANKQEESIELLVTEDNKSNEISLGYGGDKPVKTNVKKSLVETNSDSVDEISQVTTLV